MATVNELWDDLPGNGGREGSNTNPLAALRLSGEESQVWRHWASGRRLVAKAPDVVQWASHLICEHAGMEPYGTAKTWASAVYDLLRAADGDMDVLEAAVKKAAQDRETRDITLSSPRSFMGYARNELSKRRVASRPKLMLDLDTGNEKPLGAIEI